MRKCMHVYVYIYNACEFVLCFILLLPSISYGKSPLIHSSKSPFEDGVLRWNNPPRGATDRVSGVSSSFLPLEGHHQW